MLVSCFIPVSQSKSRKLGIREGGGGEVWWQPFRRVLCDPECGGKMVVFSSDSNSFPTGMFKYLGEASFVCGSYYFYHPVVVIQMFS